MRVALVVHCYFPDHFYGTETYTRSVARELKALGNEPVVITARFPGESGQDKLVDRAEVDGIPVFRVDRNVFPNRSLRDTYSYPYLRFVYERLFRLIRPDVIHLCHLINHTTALLDAAEALKIPVVATFTDFFGFCYTNKLQAASGSLCAGPNQTRSNCIECALLGHRDVDPVLRVAGMQFWRPMIARTVSRHPALAGGRDDDVRALVQRPDHLRSAMQHIRAAIAPSRFLLNAYRANGFQLPLELSHFGIDIDRSLKPARVEGPELRVAFIGQLAEHKGPHLLLEALRRVKRPRLHVTIWGDERQTPTYAADLRRLAAGQNVVFPGTFSTETIAEVLRHVDVLVIPSTWYENAPLILLQALATHTPLVVADVEGLTEFIVEDVSGLIFPRGDVGKLTALLQQLSDNPAKAAWMSTRTHYERTSRHMVEDVVALYDRYAGQSLASGASNDFLTG